MGELDIKINEIVQNIFDKEQTNQDKTSLSVEQKTRVEALEQERKDEIEKDIRLKINAICNSVGIDGIEFEAAEYILQRVYGGITNIQTLEIDRHAIDSVIDIVAQTTGKSVEEIKNMVTQNTSKIEAEKLEKFVEVALKRIEDPAQKDNAQKQPIHEQKTGIPVLINPVDTKYAFKDESDAQIEQDILEVTEGIDDFLQQYGGGIHDLQSLKVKPENRNEFIKLYKNLMRSMPNGAGVDAALRITANNAFSIFSHYGEIEEKNLKFFNNPDITEMIKALSYEIQTNPDFVQDKHTQASIMTLMASALVAEKASAAHKKDFDTNVLDIIKSIDPKTFAEISRNLPAYQALLLQRDENGGYSPFNEQVFNDTVETEKDLNKLCKNIVRGRNISKDSSLREITTEIFKATYRSVTGQNFRNKKNDLEQIASIQESIKNEVTKIEKNPQQADTRLSAIKHKVIEAQYGLGIDALLKYVSNQAVTEVLANRTKVNEGSMFEQGIQMELIKLLGKQFKDNVEFTQDKYTQAAITNIITSALVVNRKNGLSDNALETVRSLDEDLFEEINQNLEVYSAIQIQRDKKGKVIPFADQIKRTGNRSKESFLKSCDFAKKQFYGEKLPGLFRRTMGNFGEASRRMLNSGEQEISTKIKTIEEQRQEPIIGRIVSKSLPQTQKDKNLAQVLESMSRVKGVEHTLDWVQKRVGVVENPEEKKKIVELTTTMLSAQSPEQTKQNMSAKKEFFVNMFDKKLLDKDLLKKILGVSNELTTEILSHYAAKSDPKSKQMVANLESTLKEMNSEKTFSKEIPKVTPLTQEAIGEDGEEPSL